MLAYLGYILLAVFALLVLAFLVEIRRFKQDVRRNGWQVDTRKRRR